MLTRPLTLTDLPAVQTLLRESGLPTAGVVTHRDGFLLAEEAGKLVAVTGVEVHGQLGLLRSMAVRPSSRSQGVAARLIAQAITQARQRGLSDLYLLTTTAQWYFLRHGFQTLARSAAPAALNSSAEFQGACPDSAVLMHLSLQEKPMTQTLQPIPGLATATGALIAALRQPDQRPLEFWLNGERLIGPGYHVTEVKAVRIEAMDCGGRATSWRETVIQLMDGSAEDARGGFMTNRKFLAIYDRVTRKIPVRDEAEVRFEYGNAQSAARQFHVTHLEVQPERLVVHLRQPGVQCKAGEACGLPADETVAAEGCAPNSGCCGPAIAPAEPSALIRLE